MMMSQQQEQLKKLGIIIHYLDQFNHKRSLHTPRAQGQTVAVGTTGEGYLLPSRTFAWVRMAVQPYTCGF
jgi:hypothetical protein